ncbi:MAG TPA: hypothetical protein VFD43_05115, partial [Planctomycetota bacterium]|nr:hypothetical protein [Planctomycetota bacterium]
MRRMRAAGLVALGVAAAVWAAWPAPEREGVRFTLPESLDLEFPAGGIPANVVCASGRVIANRPVALVFRWLVDPVSIEVAEPAGPFELRLGPPGTGVWIQGSGAELQLCSEDGAVAELPADGEPPARVRLAWEDGAYRAQLDGRDAGARVERPPPPGPATLLLRSGSSMAALDCLTADGLRRHVEADSPPPGWERTAWAGLSALVGLLCLGGWWRQLSGAAPPGALVRAAALAAAGAVVVGLPLAYRARNAERAATPDPCALEVFESREPRLVEPGRPWLLGERRDGDFRLQASVVLDEGAALDVLLRAGLPQVDRQLLATLSADPELPSGVGRNLGTLLQTETAGAELARLPAGRPLRLQIECRDELLEARVDDRPLGTLRDLDLRAGATAFHALLGRATVAELRLEPLGQPRSLAGPLAWRALALGAGAALALLLLAIPGRLGWGAGLWTWP